MHYYLFTKIILSIPKLTDNITYNYNTLNLINMWPLYQLN